MVQCGRCPLRFGLPVWVLPLGPGLGESGGTMRDRSFWSLRMICLQRSTKASSTFALLRALVSKYGMFHSRDMANARGRDTARSSSRSDLLPMRTMGTLLSSFIRRICSRNSVSSQKDEADVMLKTKRKPWPVFMYSSLRMVSLGPTTYLAGAFTSWRLRTC